MGGEREEISIQHEANLQDMWGYPLLKANAQQSHDVETWGGSARLWIEAGTAGPEFFKSGFAWSKLKTHFIASSSIKWIRGFVI